MREKEQFLLLKKLYSKAENSRKLLKNRLRKLRDELKRKKTDEVPQYCLLKKVFNDDQIHALKRKSTKFMKWSKGTIEQALKLRIACGKNGYNELLKQSYPLPSLRTLRRNLLNISFPPEILYDCEKEAIEFKGEIKERLAQN